MTATRRDDGRPVSATTWESGDMMRRSSISLYATNDLATVSVKWRFRRSETVLVESGLRP